MGENPDDKTNRTVGVSMSGETLRKLDEEYAYSDNRSRIINDYLRVLFECWDLVEEHNKNIQMFRLPEYIIESVRIRLERENQN